MTKASAADLAFLMAQMTMGNEMIASGNNNTVDHMVAADAKVSGAKLTCADLRSKAAAWAGDRKSFIAAMVEAGANKATAATQWAKGRA